MPDPVCSRYRVQKRMICKRGSPDRGRRWIMAMVMSRLGFAAMGLLLPALAGLYACGSPSGNGGNGLLDGGVLGPSGTYGDAASPFADAPNATAILTAPDCMGCTFPPAA